MAQDAYRLQRADIACVLPVALSYVASSLVEPRPRIRECLTPQVYVTSTLSRTLRSSARPRSCSKLCSYSFLTQGKIACANILRARICTAVRTGAKRGTHFVSILYISLQIVFSPYVRKFGEGVINMQFRTSKKKSGDK